MTYMFYKRFLVIFYLLFFPVLLLSQYGDSIPWIKSHPLFLAIIFYGKAILAIVLLYFGIYAYKWKIKPAQKLKGPILIIILGGFLTLISYGPPVFHYFMSEDLRTEVVSTDKLRTMSGSSIDPDVTAQERFLTAKYYYLQTGELIEYLDKNGEKIVYLPSEIDKKERERHIQLSREFEKIVSHGKTVVVTLGAFAISSFLGFLILLRYESNKSKGSVNG